MNIIVEASRVPLDEKLFDAIGPTHREKLEELQLAGVATYATARVFRDEAGEMTYDVTANVDQISFKVPQLPHPITGGAGEAAIEPGRVIIKGLQGMYLARPIHVSGQVFLADRLGVDVQIDSPAMLLDETLEDAVSPLIRNAYVQFKPDGYAGVEVALRYNTPDQEAEETDYRVLIRPKDLVVNYQGFPLTVRAVGGTVIATPGRIELQRVISRRGGWDRHHLRRGVGRRRRRRRRPPHPSRAGPHRRRIPRGRAGRPGPTDQALQAGRDIRLESLAVRPHAQEGRLG